MLTSNEQSSLFSIFKASFGNESTALVVSLCFALKKFILVQFSFVLFVAFIDMPVVSLISVTNFSQTFVHHCKSDMDPQVKKCQSEIPKLTVSKSLKSVSASPLLDVMTQRPGDTSMWYTSSSPLLFRSRQHFSKFIHV